MNKRAIAILGAIFILIVGTLGVLIYLRSQKDNGQNTTENTQNNISNNEENTGEPTPADPQPVDPAPTPISTAVKLTDDEVVSPVLFYQGNGVTYFNSQGQLFQTELATSGSTVLLSNKRELTIALKSGITRILWPASGNNFIAEFDTGSKKYWSFYNSEAGTYTDMPSQVTAVDWLPAGDRIILVWVDDRGKATLNTANPDLSNYQSISDLYEPDDDISVSPDGRIILFWRTQSPDGKNIISSLSVDGKNYNAVVKDGYNLDVKWAPNGQRFVFGRRNAQAYYELWMADIVTGEVRSLGVETIPAKAVWSKDGRTVYAAVPSRGTTGSGLTEDAIVKIDATTSSKTEFATGTPVDATDLFLSNGEDILFFKNRQDRSLYYIDVIP